MHRPAWTRFAVVIVALTAFLTALPVAWGQEVTANIIGTVKDPSGAAVPGATVVATDTARGTVYSTTTNDVGAYAISRLKVGNYTLKVTAPGFQTVQYPPFTLVLNQTARMDISMRVGQVSQTVEVTGAAPLLQTQDTQVSTIIDSVSADKLPLATRNYVQLTLLSPGSISPDPTNFNNGDNTASGARPYINGNREQANNFILDGMDNNQVSDNLLGYTPAPDAIQEFNLITNNASAEFGDFQGGIVSTTIKSGTNSFHGDLWEYFRNDVLNANSWENNFAGTKKATLRWNMFGGTIGGPVIKNKLFFFFDYQGQRFDHPASARTFTVFTNPERQGDFGALCSSGFDASGICMDRTKGNSDPTKNNLVTDQLYNPCTTTAGPCTPANFVTTGSRTPFPFNRIPTSMINPVAQALFNSSFYPKPVNDSLQENAFNTVTQAFNNSQFDIKMDYNATAKDHIFGRYSHANQNNPSLNSLAIIGQGFSQAPINNEMADWTHTFGVNLLNDMRFGINYVKLHNGDEPNPAVGNLASELGIANGNPMGPGLMGINFGGGTPSQQGSSIISGIGDTGIQQNFRSAVIQFDDNVIITHGRHVIHTGFDYRRNRINIFYSGNSGMFGAILFSGQYTGSDPSKPVDGTGFGGADFFLGLPNSYGHGVSGGGWGQRQSVIAGYVQDDWRATDNLTINLGLRYEAFTPWVERNNRQDNATLFGGQLIAPNCSLLGTIPSNVLAGLGGCQNSSAGLYQGTYGLPDFQPRLGFAWTPASLRGKTVLRGAVTVSSYMEGTGTNLRLPINPPFSPAETLTQFNGDQFPTPTQDGILAPASAATDPFANALFRVWDPHVQPADTYQWNLTIQQELSQSTTFQIGYVGQRGIHLMVPMPYLQRQLLPNSACSTPPCTLPSVYLAGNPAFQNDISQVSGTASVGDMSYNAMQAVLQKRYSQGLQFQVAYTYSKCMTDNSGYYGTWGSTQGAPASPYYQNLYDPKADWAPCYFDSTQLLSAYANYELPYGKGKRFGNNAPAVLRAIAGGWSVNPIVSLHTGFPLAVYDFGSDPTGTNSRGLRPNCNGPFTTYGRKKPVFDPNSGNFLGFEWFDPNSFSAPAIGQFGNCPAQGPIRGPGYADVDLSLQKDFFISESKRLQFRSDFVNAFNRVNFNVPNMVLGAGMGLVNSSQDPRNIQFALKFYF
ncbi:MAG TPA: carboxypeptidase-like regulatory domain-containing protein [Terriglobales bacterium]|nr:carboxypeptidase-like regulatory domain-containing protein [Terriglobales bacterium]